MFSLSVWLRCEAIQIHDRLRECHLRTVKFRGPLSFNLEASMEVLFMNLSPTYASGRPL